jgi:hypothetical protein
MAASKTRLALFIAVPLLLLFLPLSIYFIDSAAASDKVARNVSIAGVDVSRYTEAEATEAVDEYATGISSNVVTVSVNGTEFELDSEEVGLVFESEAAVSQALEVNKDGLSDWLRAFSEEVDVPVASSIDPELLELKLTEWEQAAVPNPAFEGSIDVVGQAVVFEYPMEGEAIDRQEALASITEAVTTGSAETVLLPLVNTLPSLTEEDIDAGVARAQLIIDRGVELTNETYGFDFIVNKFSMYRALDVAVVKGDPATIEYTIDSTVIAPLVEARRASYEIAPVDAYWDIIEVDDFEDWNENYEIKDSPQEDEEGLPEDDVITLIESKMGTQLDVGIVVEAVEEAALGDGTGELVLLLTAEPEFSTDDALAYGGLYEVSEFTTFKPGTNRAHNIDLMADTIDGMMVMPGETFSVNEVIGRRTTDKGYRYDCAIVGGELSCERDPVNVGGGVSQFGTTIFNAIFFGCYEDVVHQPHSIYFRKYPEGREATLGFPSPDVAFLNNTDAPVIIKTSHTPRSITVTFFGNNGGMICDSERSERSGHTSASKSYQTDPEIWVAPDAEVVKSKGSGGWAVTVTRVFYDANGLELEREPFYWRYRGEKNVILLNPCDPRVGGNGVCEEPVPSVVGQEHATGRELLLGLGYSVSANDIEACEQEGIIVGQSKVDEYVKPGSTIAISVGICTPPEETEETEDPEE